MYLLERVMYPFEYLQVILRHPSDYAPPTVHHRDLGVILEDLDSHVVLEEYRRVSTPVNWAYAYCYITWFYGVSHPIMTPYTPGRSPRPSNQNILEARNDHTQDVISVCQRIVDMWRSSIKTRLFLEGSPSWPS